MQKSKTGRIVTTMKWAMGKLAYANIRGWNTACDKARMALGVTSVQLGKTGSPLYKLAREIYDRERDGETYMQTEINGRSLWDFVSPEGEPSGYLTYD